ncbi:MAG: hypothetical protein ACI93R_004197, partial [Flavobacteriales bacterium]
CAGVVANLFVNAYSVARGMGLNSHGGPWELVHYSVH